MLLYSRWRRLRRQRYIKFLLGDDPFDLVDVLLERRVKRKYQVEENLRYSAESRPSYWNGLASAVFREDLKEDSPWLNAAEFKCKYQMTRSSCWLIVGLIKDHQVFKGGRRKQAPVEHQLMTLLCFLGTEGTGMSNRRGRSVFRLGKEL